MKLLRFLHVKSNGECRVTRGDHGRWDEVSFRLNVEIPDVWGHVVGSIDLTLPTPTPAAISVMIKQAKAELISGKDGTDGKATKHPR